MATRVKPKYGHVQYGFQNNHSTVPAIQTEFCVRASKLDFGGSKKTGAGVFPPSCESQSQKKSESKNVKQNDHSIVDASIVQSSTLFLTEFSRLANRSHSKCNTFGVMGRKYLKKPAKIIPQKSTKSETQDCASVTEASTLQNITACSPTSSRGKGVPHRSSFIPTEFGFRKIRTDTFSGLSRNRKTKGSSLEKDIAEGARRHIIACHIAPTARRGCRAVENYYALKHCVSPVGKFTRQMSTKSQISTSTQSIESMGKAHTSQMRSSKVSLTLSATYIASMGKEKLPEVIGKVIHNVPKSQKLFEIV